MTAAPYDQPAFAPLFPFSDIPYLETDRLILRENSPKVVRVAFEELSDAELQAFYGLPDQKSVDDERELQKLGYETVNITYKNWLLIRKEKAAIIGAMGFHTWQPAHFRAEIGYAIADLELRGQRYSTEALTAVLHHGFMSMNLNRVEAYVGTTNKPSLKMMRRFGFTKEGVLREHYNSAGNIQDSVIFGLLRKDYLPTLR